MTTQTSSAEMEAIRRDLLELSYQRQALAAFMREQLQRSRAVIEGLRQSFAFPK